MGEQKKGKGPFDSISYLSNVDFTKFVEEMEEHQERYMGDVNELIKQSSELGKDGGNVLEQNKEHYDELMELWEDFSQLSEEITKDEFEEDFYKEFQEQNREITNNIEELVDTSLQDAEELYSSWRKLSESIFQGIKAGTGPHPDDIMDASADFQKTALHVARRNMEEGNESLRELRKNLERINEESIERMKDNAKTSTKKLDEFFDTWQNSVEDMEEKVNESIEKTQKIYLSAFEPYFGPRTVFPFFSWFKPRKMREYEEDLMELREKIDKLEDQMEG